MSHMIASNDPYVISHYNIPSVYNPLIACIYIYLDEFTNTLAAPVVK